MPRPIDARPRPRRRAAGVSIEPAPKVSTGTSITCIAVRAMRDTGSDLPMTLSPERTRPARAPGEHDRQVVDVVVLRQLRLRVRHDEHAVEERAVAFRHAVQNAQERAPRLHDVGNEPRGLGLVAEGGVDRLVVRQLVVRGRAAAARQRRGAVVEAHVEHLRLVAGQRHGEQPRHDLVVCADVLQHVGHLALAPGRGRRLARDQRLRLLELQGELALHLPDAGEVLIESRPIRRAEPPLERPPLLADHRQHAAARHGDRIGREGGGVGIHEALAEDALVEARGGRLDRVHLSRALAAQRVRAVADGRHVERAEARAAADVRRDDAVERRRGERAAHARRHAGAEARPAGRVREVGLAVRQAVEAAEDRHLVLVRRHRLRLGQDLVVRTGPRRMEAARRHAQAPEPGAEPHRERGAGRQGRPVAVQEAIQVGQRHRDGRALADAAQDGAPADP